MLCQGPQKPRLEQGPRVRHRGIKGPPLCCEIKKEKIHVWSGGGKRAGPGLGENKRERERACERRESRVTMARMASR